MSETVYDFGPVASTDALCDFLKNADAVAFKAALLARIREGITNNQFRVVQDACTAAAEDLIKELKKGKVKP